MRASELPVTGSGAIRHSEDMDIAHMAGLEVQAPAASYARGGQRMEHLAAGMAVRWII